MNHLKLQKSHFVVVPCVHNFGRELLPDYQRNPQSAPMKNFLDQAVQQNMFLGEILVAIIGYLWISVDRVIKLMPLLRRVWRVVVACVTVADAETQFTMIQPFITCMLACISVAFACVPIFFFLFLISYLISQDALRYYSIYLSLSAKKSTLANTDHFEQYFILSCIRCSSRVSSLELMFPLKILELFLFFFGAKSKLFSMPSETTILQLIFLASYLALPKVYIELP